MSGFGHIKLTSLNLMKELASGCDTGTLKDTSDTAAGPRTATSQTLRMITAQTKTKGRTQLFSPPPRLSFTNVSVCVFPPETRHILTPLSLSVLRNSKEPRRNGSKRGWKPSRVSFVWKVDNVRVTVTNTLDRWKRPIAALSIHTSHNIRRRKKCLEAVMRES